MRKYYEVSPMSNLSMSLWQKSLVEKGELFRKTEEVMDGESSEDEVGIL